MENLGLISAGFMHPQTVTVDEIQDILKCLWVLFLQRLIHHQAFLTVNYGWPHALVIVQPMIRPELGQCRGNPLYPVARTEPASIFNHAFNDQPTCLLSYHLKDLTVNAHVDDSQQELIL